MLPRKTAGQRLEGPVARRSCMHMKPDLLPDRVSQTAPAVRGSTSLVQPGPLPMDISSKSQSGLPTRGGPLSVESNVLTCCVTGRSDLGIRSSRPAGEAESRCCRVFRATGICNEMRLEATLHTVECFVSMFKLVRCKCLLQPALDGDVVDVARSHQGSAIHACRPKIAVLQEPGASIGETTNLRRAIA